jgi:hypothetical protein
MAQKGRLNGLIFLRVDELVGSSRGKWHHREDIPMSVRKKDPNETWKQHGLRTA